MPSNNVVLAANTSALVTGSPIPFPGFGVSGTVPFTGRGFSTPLSFTGVSAPPDLTTGFLRDAVQYENIRDFSLNQAVYTGRLYPHMERMRPDVPLMPRRRLSRYFPLLLIGGLIYLFLLD